MRIINGMKYRGKEVFKPLNTGVIDEHVKCLREYIANIFFHTKNGTTEAGGANDFVREYTLASGGPYCDCGYKKKSPLND